MRSRTTDIAPTLPKLTVTFLKNVQGKLIRARLTIETPYSIWQSRLHCILPGMEHLTLFGP